MPEIPDSAVQAAMARKADLLSDCPSPTALSEETLTRLMLEAAAPAMAEAWGARSDCILSAPEDLTDEALTAANRLHDIVDAARPGGVHDPRRNPGGCDKVFCCRILIEVPAVIEPAIRADERRRRGPAERIEAPDAWPQATLDPGDPTRLAMIPLPDSEAPGE